MEDIILNTYKCNYIKVYSMFIVMTTCFICTINDCNCLVAMHIGFWNVCLYIYDFYKYIEVELKRSDDIIDCRKRKDTFLRMGFLLDNHNIIVGIVMILSIILYWIYYIKCTRVYPASIILAIYYLMSAFCTGFTVGRYHRFLKCSHKYECIIKGIMNNKLRGL